MPANPQQTREEYLEKAIMKLNDELIQAAYVCLDHFHYPETDGKARKYKSGIDHLQFLLQRIKMEGS